MQENQIDDGKATTKKNLSRKVVKQFKNLLFGFKAASLPELKPIEANLRQTGSRTSL